MKKLLSILGIVTLATTSLASVVACTGSRKDVIKFLLNENPNEFWNQYIKAGEDTIKNNEEWNDKYKFEWVSAESNPAKELSNAQAAIDGGAKGIILSQMHPDVRKAMEYINENDIPVISSNIPIRAKEVLEEKQRPNYDVSQDGEVASFNMGYRIFELLTDLYYPKTTNSQTRDYEKIGIFEIWGTTTAIHAKTRHDGFAKGGIRDNKLLWEWKGLVDKNDPVNGQGVSLPDNKAFSIDGGYDATKENIKYITQKVGEKYEVKVIYAANDAMARGAVNYLKSVDEGKEWLKWEFNGDGSIKKHGGIVVGYDYENITQKEIASWKENSQQIFASIQMSAQELAKVSVEKTIEEIENDNKNKQQQIHVDIPSKAWMPELFKKYMEMKVPEKLPEFPKK